MMRSATRRPLCSAAYRGSFPWLCGVLLFTAATARAEADANADGLDDVWEQAFGASGLPADGDPDGDGASNRSESVMGTDPFDGGDRLALESPLIVKRALKISWQSVEGKRYQTEWLTPAGWVACDRDLVGTGGPLISAIPTSGAASRMIRVRIADDITSAVSSASMEIPVDSDGDGQADLFEYQSGTDHLSSSSQFRISGTSFGDTVSLRWKSSIGKVYRLECSTGLTGSTWEPVSAPVPGTGKPIEVDCPKPSGRARFYRLRVSDNDQDKDGFSDWAEAVAGSDPKHPGSFPGTPLPGQTTVRVEVSAATALVNRGESGGFRLVREGFFGPLKIRLQPGGTAVAGPDYQQLPDEIRMEAGQREIGIPVLPATSTMPLAGKSVSLRILPGRGYQIGADSPRDVRLLAEHRISVKDFGAKGDGVTDDTAAIQAAINALETSASANSLWFPAGRYRLATLTPQSWTPGSYHCTLQLPGGTATDKDLVFSGEPGAVLYAEPGSTRCQMWVVPSRHRSYSFRGLIWEKSPEPRLMPSAGVEPNWSDGVSLVCQNGIGMAEASFLGCQFINCHGAVRTYGAGTDLRGGLGVFRMGGCKVLNPYGSNAMTSPHPYGGGQQINLTPWVRYACYEGNEFNGSSDGPADETFNPGLVPKDGCHFGSPLELRFVNNTVRNMGVEAVFKTQDTWFNTTATAFAIPSPGQDTVEVTLQPWAVSTAIPGNHYLFRFTTQAGVQVHIVLTAVSHDRTANRITLRNADPAQSAHAGMTIPAGTPIYWQEALFGDSDISGNAILNGRPEAIGIASNTRTGCANNIIHGYGTGAAILQSPQNPFARAGAASRFDNNFIVVAPQEATWTRSGFYLEAPDISVTNNQVNLPTPLQTVGIRMESSGIFAGNNRLHIASVSHSGYQNAQRAVGIGVGPSATGTHMRTNHTSGFDVGIGQSTPSQAAVPFTVGPHSSSNDAIAIDPKGGNREPGS